MVFIIYRTNLIIFLLKMYNKKVKEKDHFRKSLMYKSKSILVCVPARHGSKSIKNKNLQKVGNETLVARSIRHAKSSNFVDEVVVSTNSDKIKKEALSHGAKVLDRPESISVL